MQEVGRVLSVGDGIARIYGLKGVKVGLKKACKGHERPRNAT